MAESPFDLQTWSIHTDVFDGPLDLLLYLVRRDGIDLQNLKIAPIADAYLAFTDQMRIIHLGIAGEYLVMAATLVYLKSLELLPRRPTSVEEEEEVEDPREALAKRLIEYQRYREAAQQLSEGTVLGRDTFERSPEEIDDARRPVTTDVDAFGLLEVFYELLTKSDAPDPQIEVGHSGPDFGTCCRRVLVILGGVGGKAELGPMLLGLPEVADRVVTFVAVLEMARLQWLKLAQKHHLSAVTITSGVPPNQDLSVLTGRVAEAS